MLARGVLWALTAAALHTAIDFARKVGQNQGIPPFQLVCLCALIDAVLGGLGVVVMGGFRELHIPDPHTFTIIVCTSSAILVLSKVLYQRAMTSPLSLTVPYLAFTPTFLVGTAFFLVGEMPTPVGLTGVAIVTLGGYLLSRVSAPEVAGAGGDLHGGMAEQLHRDGSLLEKGEAADPKKDSPGVKGGIRRTTSSGGPCTLIDRLAGRRRGPGLSGPCLMLLVAALFSVTASLDKLGVLYSSLWVYFAAQRVTIGVACTLYMLVQSRESFRYMRSHFWTLLGVSLFEMASVMAFLQAIKFVLVSYVMAIKRSNVLLSVAVGGLVFGESVMSRIPYVLLMLSGMGLIVLF